MRVPRIRTILVLVTVLAVALAAVLAVVVAGGRNSGAASPVAPGTASSTADPASVAPRDWRSAGVAFLDRYLDPDGRVVRHDQGGDTVSEGQAYAMLIALAVDDRKRFDLAWTWTRDQLQRPEDGLLSWRWADGSVVDRESAADADLDVARALVLAGARFDAPELRTAGVALGQAVLDHETAVTDDGRILLAGTWVGRRAPLQWNPSYSSPGATRVLAEADPDPRWAQLDAGSRAITETLLTTVDLPPDWAQVRDDGQIDPMPGAAGRGSEGVRYGYDAFRLGVRFAESCSAEDVRIAAAQVPALDRFEGAPAVRDLGGKPLSEGDAVIGAVGQAAAHAAAGETATAATELDLADRLAASTPSYYGDAWAVLATLMLTTDVLGGCPVLDR